MLITPLAWTPLHPQLPLKLRTPLPIAPDVRYARYLRRVAPKRHAAKYIVLTAIGNGSTPIIKLLMFQTMFIILLWIG